MNLTGAYRIYLRTRDGRLRHGLRLPAWLPAAFVLVTLALTGHLLWRLPEIRDLDRLTGRLAQARLERNAEWAGLVALWETLSAHRRDVDPVASLNGKLAALTSLGEGARQQAFVGSPAMIETGLSDEKRLARQIQAMTTALVEEIAFQRTRQMQLTSILHERALEFAARPSLWPSRGTLNSDFGYRFMGRSRDFHNGVDIGMPVGSPVVAPADGKVASVSYESGYGLTVVLEHRHGVSTLYAHLKSSTVEPGDEVKRGALIAHSGMSGRTTGSHLHYEVRLNGQPVDPMNYMLH